ncbi:MAG: MOSC domain-containing protein [Chloroflexi bacterium]|nr:MOSC domain-containing protein [Chloroflexota bacterium]
MADSELGTGSVVALFIVDRREAPMKKVEQLNAIAGKGLEGDRYLLGTGTYSKKPEPGRQVTLIKSETLKSLKDEFDITVKPEESRRNILTQDIEINDLIGTEFCVGPVRPRAHRITQPCLYLENLLEQPGLYKELWDNGGISCEILSDGVIKEGDTITSS